jgi:hypothetical protein
MVVVVVVVVQHAVEIRAVTQNKRLMLLVLLLFAFDR